MNKTYNNLIKKTFASVKGLALWMILMISAIQMVNAQCTTAASLIRIPRSGTVTVNSLVLTTTYTGAVSESTAGETLSCIPGNHPSPTLAFTGGTLTINFDKPTNDLVIYLSGFGSGGSPSSVETITFTTNNGTPVTSAVSGTTCGTISTLSNTVRGSGGLNGGSFKVTAPAAFTQLVITGGTSALLGVAMSACGTSIVAACGAGTTAPPLNATTLSNVCPATTVNLNNLHSGTVPGTSQLVWFTNNNHTGSAYATPTTAAAGTYYAYYYDSTNNCYSPASNAVTVTISTCCAAGTTAPVLGSPTA